MLCKVLDCRGRAYQLLGYAHSNQGKDTEAAAAWRSALDHLQSPPAVMDTLLGLANLCVATAENELGLGYVARAKAAADADHPVPPLTRLVEGSLLVGLNRHTEALTVFQDFRRLDLAACGELARVMPRKPSSSAG